MSMGGRRDMSRSRLHLDLREKLIFRFLLVLAVGRSS